MHLDDVHSNFIYLYVLLDTSNIDPALRPYLPLLLESLLELPVQRGEALIPYEEIVAELENDTITAETRLGLDSSARFSCGPYAQVSSFIIILIISFFTLKLLLAKQRYKKKQI